MPENQSGNHPDIGQSDSDRSGTWETEAAESAPQTSSQEPGKSAQTSQPQSTPRSPDSPDLAPDGVSTRYERTTEGHRITRRTIHRNEVSEDTHETIEETFPVAGPATPVPMPYAPPTPDHPSPVG